LKKRAGISILVFFSLLILTRGIFAQIGPQDDPRFLQDELGLNLNEEQTQKIQALERGLAKDLDLLYSKLRSRWMRLEDLEGQKNPDIDEMDRIWESIYELENEARKRELGHQREVRGVLTQEQKEKLDAFEASGPYFYGRGPMGRGNRGYGGGISGGYTAYCPAYGRMRWGQRIKTQGNFGYGYPQGQWRGYGQYRGIYGPGAGRSDAGYSPYSSLYRYGRGPCGMGWGRWYHRGYGRGYRR
jgi:hypothetical protein